MNIFQETQIFHFKMYAVRARPLYFLLLIILLLELIRADSFLKNLIDVKYFK